MSTQHLNYSMFVQRGLSYFEKEPGKLELKFIDFSLSVKLPKTLRELP